MNQNLINAINPLSEHLESQKMIQRQNSLLGYFITFALGVLVCFVVMNMCAYSGMKEEKTKDY